MSRVLSSGESLLSLDIPPQTKLEELKASVNLDLRTWKREVVTSERLSKNISNLKYRRYKLDLQLFVQYFLTNKVKINLVLGSSMINRITSHRYGRKICAWSTPRIETAQRFVHILLQGKKVMVFEQRGEIDVQIFGVFSLCIVFVLPKMEGTNKF